MPSTCFGANARNRANRSAIILVLLMTFLPCGVFPGAARAQVREEQPAESSEQQVSEPQAHWALQDESQALRAVAAILGRGFDGAVKVGCELAILTNDQTPYLADQINGKPVWAVHLKDWPVPWSSSPGSRGGATLELTVYVNAESWQLIRLETPWREGATPRLVDPPRHRAEQQMWSHGHEVYHGFADPRAAVSFADALDGVKQKTMDPLHANQVIAQLLLMSEMGKDPVPRWIITLRGVFPRRGRGKVKSSQLRCIVDANTGALILTTNSPHAGRPRDSIPPSVGAAEPTAMSVEQAAELDPGRFIHSECLEYAQNEQGRPRVLVALERVVRIPTMTMFGAAGVRALFHIGERTPETRDALLRIVVDLGAARSVRSVAAEHLVLWSDDEPLRRRLLVEVEKNFMNGSTASLPLREFGDTAYLRFLERTLAELPDADPSSRRVKAEIAYVSAVNELPDGDLVGLFSRVAPYGEQRFLLQAAIRKGVDRNTLREGAVAYILGEKESDRRDMGLDFLIVRCFATCVFSDEDEALLPGAHEVRERFPASVFESTGHPPPAWTTRSWESLDQFHRRSGFCDQPGTSAP